MPRNPSVVDLATAAARAADARQHLIANNLANLRKPGYLRKDIRFEELLAEQLEGRGSAELEEVIPEMITPRTTPLGPNGNDVHLDHEMGELMSNSGRYKTMMRVLKRSYQQLEMAMKTEG